MENLIQKYPSLTSRIKSFYPFQNDAIKAVLDGKNCLVIAPTGKGKSLIYQIAGQEMPGTTIVVSPLIALIDEQVAYLGEDLALSLTSNLSFTEQRETLRDLANKELVPKFIFVSPERLQNYFFRSAIKKSELTLSMIVIDEAHCISQWGFDFRPEYSQVNQFIEFVHKLGHAPSILAMTATIGKKAQADILSEFNIQSELVFNDTDFIRQELVLNFVEVEKEKEKYDKILEIVSKYAPRKALIYFYDKSHCKQTCDKLNAAGILSATFYSGMDSDEKEVNYHCFKNGSIIALCATSAFGMGMNIPDIDMVIHHRLPDCIEEYYQQVGRAARDKTICPVAHCFALWSTVNIEYKYDEFIPAVVLQPDQIKNAFSALGLTGQAGKPQSMEYSNYIKQNLGRIRYELEKRNILTTIGEVNGSPKSIVFYNDNPYWDRIVKNMKIGNSFIRAAANSGLSLQELIDYVFDQELAGKITKLPAMEKKIFFVSEYNEIPFAVILDIVKESDELSDFKKQQVDKLYEMILAENKHEYISKYFEALN